MASLSVTPITSPSSVLLHRRASDDESLDDPQAPTELNKEELMEANFEPSTWIMCCGILEKKRDGVFREGWAKRFFVLSKHALYYYITAKPDRAGYTPLLGEERGQIRLADLVDCKFLGQDKEYCFIELDIKNVRKQNASGIFQPTVQRMLLRTPVDSGQLWFTALKKSCRAASAAAVSSQSPLMQNASSPFSSFTRTVSESSPRKSPKRRLQQPTAAAAAVPPQTVLSLISVEEAFPLAKPMPIAPFALLCLALPWVIPHIDHFGVVVAVELLICLAFVEFKRREMNFNSFVRDARLRLTMAQKEAAAMAAAAVCCDEDYFDDLSAVVATCVPLGVHAAGSSMRFLESGIPGKDFMTWSNSDSKAFKLRIGPNYKKLGLKAPSLDAMYTVIGMDLVKCTLHRMNNVMHHPKLSSSQLCSFEDLDSYQRAGVPKYFVVNAQIPGNSPSLFGGDDKQDLGYSLIMYFQCKQDLLHSMLTCEPPLPPAVRLLQEYCRDHAINPDIRRRFKAMGMVENLKDVGMPGVGAMIEKFQGKPAIINKVAEIYESKDRGAWFEVDISIFDFPFVAKKALDALKDRVAEIRLKAGFTLQGEQDDELPECLLGAVDICGLDFRLAKVL